MTETPSVMAGFSSFPRRLIVSNPAIPDPSPNEMGTIARAGALLWFLWQLGPGERFTVAQVARATAMSWDAAKYQLTMLAISIPLRQNADSSWQIIPDDDINW